MLNFGGNDVFGINSNDIGALTGAQAGALVVSNIVSAVTTLSNIGAGNILVMGIPNTDATGYAIDFALQSALDTLQPSLSANLYRYSYYGFYNRVLSDPTAYGYPANLDVSTPCIAVQPVINGKIDCTGYFSFDGTHFTNQAHSVIYRDLVQVLGVPEPASWAMLISGFALVGGALRRRREVAVAD